MGTNRQTKPTRTFDDKNATFPTVAHTSQGTPIQFRYEVEIDDKLGLVASPVYVTAGSKEHATAKLNNKFKLSASQGALEIKSMFCIGTRAVNA